MFLFLTIVLMVHVNGNSPASCLKIIHSIFVDAGGVEKVVNNQSIALFPSVLPRWIGFTNR